ncbi:probable FMP25 Found in Mitochondrial Proteome [Rhynchosporium agropyri]|uniref:Probable FMP25 Found in Mitochondrial Proteome n=1 Tax=Rhynchosporium agropyri TaxID=914238 RepID=A0A1E1LGR5_9HELO|nr:probable FMP25 Found in Mitochondrial Proteome [Rhynchosporium agropyri]
MMPSRVNSTPFSLAQRVSKLPRSAAQRRCFRGQNQSRVAVASRTSGSRKAGLFFSIVVGGGILYSCGYPRTLQAEEIPGPAEVKFEQPRKKATSREENRDLISSQHLQVKKSWENPGVYAWGSNSGRVVAPDSDEPSIKAPRRIPYFDGKLIRDIKLDSNFGAAIAENGDLLQWGAGFSTTTTNPTPTLVGKDLVKLTISRDRIVALSSNGTVYSISANQKDQLAGPKALESSWFPYWNSRSNISYRTISLKDLSWGERVSDISTGLEHSLILTTKGRLFSAATATEEFPSKGQLGIPGLTWATRPEGAVDQPHEISTLKGFEIAKIAAGNFHSLAADRAGRVFAFGDNSVGQLGFDPSAESPVIDAPSLLPIDKLYKGTFSVPKVTNIAAGGVNSFFTIDATRIAGQGEEDPRGLGRVTADTWACGQGIFGGLGNGRWTHVQGTPTKIKALSGLFEYDEITSTVVPIRLASLSVGATHMSAVMDNITHLKASKHSSENDTNWGADVLWWGGNEFYQVGTGKRNNVSNPVYIAPLDADQERGRREEHRFQITPRTNIRFGGRNVSVEQRIECGRGVTAVYSGT